MTRVGLLSDTHGLLRPEVTEMLRGYDRIIHAGDIGDPSILDLLSALAPTTAVRGNNDTDPWTESLRDTELVEVGNLRIFVVHDIAKIAIDPELDGIGVIVSGHSHKPTVFERRGVLYVNPGSAGPRRFQLPISVGEILVSETTVSARTIEVKVDTRA